MLHLRTDEGLAVCGEHARDWTTDTSLTECVGCLRQRVEELEREMARLRGAACEPCPHIERAEAAEAKLARCVEAALDLVGEYESHGGEDTHQECLEGCGCMLPQKVAALRAAAKGE